MAAQELRITVALAIPVENGDAFALAERIAEINGKIKETTAFVEERGGQFYVSSKLVSPRKRDDAAEESGEPAPAGAEPGEG